MTEQIEKRYITARDLEIRATDDGKKTLRGYAAVFNSMSENLGGFREKIAPGAFASSIGPDADVRAFWNHNSDVVLGRTISGTLRLSEDDVGLAIEIDPPASASSFIESVERGDVDQMSFGFSVKPDGDRVDYDDDGMVIRTLTDVRLFEVSPVAMPAYTATSISARALEDLQRRAAPKVKEESEAQARRIRMKRQLLDARQPKTEKVTTHV